MFCVPVAAVAHACNDDTIVCRCENVLLSEVSFRARKRPSFAQRDQRNVRRGMGGSARMCLAFGRVLAELHAGVASRKHDDAAPMARPVTFASWHPQKRAAE